MGKWAFSDFRRLGLSATKWRRNSFAPKFTLRKCFQSGTKDNTLRIIHGGKTAQILEKMGNSPPRSHWSLGIKIREIYVSRTEKPDNVNIEKKLNRNIISENLTVWIWFSKNFSSMVKIVTPTLAGSLCEDDWTDCIFLLSWKLFKPIIWIKIKKKQNLHLKKIRKKIRKKFGKKFEKKFRFQNFHSLHSLDLSR